MNDFILKHYYFYFICDCEWHKIDFLSFHKCAYLTADTLPMYFENVFTSVFCFVYNFRSKSIFLTSVVSLQTCKIQTVCVRAEPLKDHNRSFINFFSYIPATNSERHESIEGLSFGLHTPNFPVHFNVCAILQPA